MANAQTFHRLRVPKAVKHVFLSDVLITELPNTINILTYLNKFTMLRCVNYIIRLRDKLQTR